MKKLAILLLVLLTACTGNYEGYLEYHVQLSPVNVQVHEITLAPTMVVPSPTIVATKTPIPTFTPIPTPTSTLVPTFTPTLIPTVTSAPLQNALYVSLEGNNANSGTLDAPYRTIQYAVSKAQPGTTIYIRGGTYSEYVIVSKSGTADAPITLTSYPGEMAILDGGSTTALRSSAGLAYWIIDGLTIKSTNRYTTRFGYWGETPTHNITVRNCTLYGANITHGSYNLYEGNEVSGIGYTGTQGDAGLMEISSSHHNTFRGNNVHDFTKYNARGIWSQGLTHDSLFENNTVTNIWSSSGGLGQCINMDGAGNVEWRHTVRNNTVNQCSYVGIQLENNFETVVEGNTINSEGSAGIIIISYDSKVGCKVGGEDNQYGNATSCKGVITNNQILNNIITTVEFWGYGYAGIKDWDTAGMLIKGNVLTAGQWNTNYPAISIDGDTEDMVRDVILQDNTILTK